MRVSGIFVLLACLVLAACDQAPQPGLKIGVVDIARLMRDSVPGQDGARALEALEEELKTRLEEINAKVERDPENEALLRELQTAYGSAQQRLQILGQNVAGALYDTLQKVLDQYRAANGYDILLAQDTVVSFAQSQDVTNAVMEELNRQKVDFLSLPTEVQLPEPDAAIPVPAQSPEPAVDSGSESSASESTPAESPAASETGQSGSAPAEESSDTGAAEAPSQSSDATPQGDSPVAEPSPAN